MVIFAVELCEWSLVSWEKKHGEIFQKHAAERLIFLSHINEMGGKTYWRGNGL